MRVDDERDERDHVPFANELPVRCLEQISEQRAVVGQVLSRAVVDPEGIHFLLEFDQVGDRQGRRISGCTEIVLHLVLSLACCAASLAGGAALVVDVVALDRGERKRARWIQALSMRFR